MAALRDLIAGLLYPPDAGCLACGRMRVDVPEQGLCADCARDLRPFLSVEPMEGLDACLCAYPYAGVSGRLVRRLKYSAYERAADVLAAGMAELAPVEDVDALVPVPLHAKRQRQRGFNQAALLCDRLTVRTGVPTLHALVRERPTRTQTRLSAAERTENVVGAFATSLPVAGRSLLLVDDVLTTGATATACAQVLRAAGAHRVLLLAAARAGVDEDV